NVAPPTPPNIEERGRRATRESRPIGAVPVHDRTNTTDRPYVVCAVTPDVEERVPLGQGILPTPVTFAAREAVALAGRVVATADSEQPKPNCERGVPLPSDRS